MVPETLAADAATHIPSAQSILIDRFLIQYHPQGSVHTGIRGR